MIKLFYLLPVLMCLFWWKYLDVKGFSVKDGIRGFAYIIAFNAVLIGFFVTMVFVTN